MNAVAKEKVIAWLLSRQLGEPVDPQSFRSQLPAIAAKLAARSFQSDAGMQRVSHRPTEAMLRDRLAETPTADALLDLLPWAVAFGYLDLENFILKEISRNLDEVILALLERV